MSYEEEYHSSVHNNLLNDNKYYLFRARCSDRFYWKYLKDKVLDYGCGLGQNIFLHKDAVGYDVSKFSLDFCKKKGINVIEKVEGEYDGVLCVHVLEHLEDPTEKLREMFKALKKDGVLVLVLPYSKNREIKNFKSDVAKHLFNWNFACIDELLTLVGFKVLVNKFNYASGYSKLYKFNFKFALGLLKVIGLFRRKKEMIIVARK